MHFILLEVATVNVIFYVRQIIHALLVITAEQLKSWQL